MGLFFKSQREKDAETAMKILSQYKKQGRFTCYYCGNVFTVTYYGNNDTYTCKKCGTKNQCE